MFSKVFEYFLLTCLKAEQVYPERGGGLPLVLQQPHAAANHERDGGGPRQVHLQVTCTLYTCTSVHTCRAKNSLGETSGEISLYGE